MLRNNKLNILATALLLSLPTVLAQNGIAGTLSTIFTALQSILTTPAIRFGLVFVGFFIVIYGIFAAGLAVVPAFKENEKLNKNGTLVAVGATILSTTGIFVTTNGSPEEAVTNILTAFGIYGSIFISVLIFLMMYFILKDTELFTERKWQMMITYLGIALFLGGTILPNKEWTGWGSLFLIIGILFVVLSLFGGEGDAGGIIRNAIDNITGGPRNKRPPKTRTPKGHIPRQVKGHGEYDTSENKIKISWEENPKEDNVTAYIIRRKERFGWGNPLHSDSTLRDSNNPWIDDTVSRGKKYKYKLSAMNNNGEGQGLVFDFIIPLSTTESIIEPKTETESAPTPEPNSGVELEIKSPKNGDMKVPLIDSAEHAGKRAVKVQFEVKNLPEGDSFYTVSLNEKQIAKTENKLENRTYDETAWIDDDKLNEDYTIEVIIVNASGELASAKSKFKIDTQNKKPSSEPGNTEQTEKELDIKIITPDKTEFHSKKVLIDGIVKDKKIPAGTPIWINWRVNGKWSDKTNQAKNQENIKETPLVNFEEGKSYKIGLAYYDQLNKKWYESDDDITINIKTSQKQIPQNEPQLQIEFKQEEKINEDIEKDLQEAYSISPYLVFSKLGEVLSKAHGTFSISAEIGNIINTLLAVRDKYDERLEKINKHLEKKIEKDNQLLEEIEKQKEALAPGNKSELQNIMLKLKGHLQWRNNYSKQYQEKHKKFRGYLGKLIGYLKTDPQHHGREKPEIFLKGILTYLKNLDTMKFDMFETLKKINQQNFSIRETVKKFKEI